MPLTTRLVIFALPLLITAGCGYRPSPEALRHYREGVDDLGVGAYYQASQALEQASIDPRFTLARARLAEAYFELDLSDKAERALPPSNQAEIRAVQLTLGGKFEDAAGVYREITGAYLDLGRSYERAGQLDHAIEAYRLATRRLPRDPAAWLRLAVAYARSFQEDRAAQAFDRAAQLSRNAAEVQYQRAMMAKRLGNADQARTLLAEVAQAGSLPQQIAALLALGDTAKALDLAHAHQVEYLAAPGLLDSGDLATSLEIARRFHMKRTEARALYALGRRQKKQGDLTAAFASFQEALTLGDSEGSALDMGAILVEQGRLPDALPAFRNAGSQLDLAGVLWRLGRYPEAQRAIADAGPSPSRMLAAIADATRAQIALSQGDYAAAIALSQSALKLRNLGIDTAVAAKSTMGAAKIHAGARAEGLASLAEAARIAEESDSQSVTAEARLAYAEAAHRTDLARTAQQQFGKLGNLEGEWRCWEVIGDFAKATQLRATLQQQWGAEDFRTYLARPDIAALAARH